MIDIEAVTKRYGAQTVVSGVTLALPAGGVTAPIAAIRPSRTSTETSLRGAAPVPSTSWTCSNSRSPPG